MTFAAKDLTMIRDLVLRRSGIVLDETKTYLIEGRVTALARKLGLANVELLLAKLRAPMPGDPLRAVDAVVEAMTTNETSFFRDSLPFDAFRAHAIPDLLERRASERRLNIWSAASSTGQEPYTLALLLREHFPQLASWTVTLIASDLSGEVLAKARAGRYSVTDIGRGLTAPLLAKYFRRDGGEYEVSADLRRMVDFRQINLLDAWPTMPKFDVVFVRNVLIYFGAETKQKILGRMRGVMQPDGYLFLGAAETTMNIDDAFERGPLDRSGCYRLRPPAAIKMPKPAAKAA
jgi:chemotaxis protein methyltransferase CheR